MKKVYKKPMIEIEKYELDTRIASGCSSIVSLGPGDLTHPVCDEYVQTISLYSDDVASDGATFYEGSCSCYLSSVGSVLLTS